MPKTLKPSPRRHRSELYADALVPMRRGNLDEALFLLGTLAASSDGDLVHRRGSLDHAITQLTNGRSDR